MPSEVETDVAIPRGGSTAKLQWFLIASTCLLYLVAAGLFSRAVWDFEQQQWNYIVGGDAAELGDGAGSYDIDKSVWHVNVSNPPTRAFPMSGSAPWHANKCSAAPRSSTEDRAGASSMPSSAGRIRPPMAP